MNKKMIMGLISAAVIGSTVAGSAAITFAADTTEITATVVETASVKDGFTVKDVNKTMYVTSNDGLFVRLQNDKDSKKIGELDCGDAVKVTGMVQQNSKDTDWVRVEFNKKPGFVNVKFLSDYAPAAVVTTSTTKTTASSTSSDTSDNGAQMTDGIIYLYDINDNLVGFHVDTKNNLYDSNGVMLYWVDDITMSNGSEKFYTVPVPADHINTDIGDAVVDDITDPLNGYDPEGVTDDGESVVVEETVYVDSEEEAFDLAADVIDNSLNGGEDVIVEFDF